MTEKLNIRKYNIIEEIVKLEDENLLSAIEEQLEQAKITYSDKQQNEEREKQLLSLAKQAKELNLGCE